MLSPLTNQEAVLSSKIEGTQATVDEVLEYQAGLLFDVEKDRTSGGHELPGNASSCD